MVPVKCAGKRKQQQPRIQPQTPHPVVKRLEPLQELTHGNACGVNKIKEACDKYLELLNGKEDLHFGKNGQDIKFKWIREPLQELTHGNACVIAENLPLALDAKRIIHHKVFAVKNLVVRNM